MIQKKLNRILVPLDGSKNSQRGLEMAISLARQNNATITGVYSVYLPSHSEFTWRTDVEKTLIKEIKKMMEKYKFLAAQNGIVFKSKILRGDPGNSIVRLANKDKYDIIVIGSRGRSSLRELFFGSVSNYVIHASKVPVLVVK